MSDNDETVTRDVTRESQPPVPTRPNPTRPALYRDRGDLASCRPVGDAREPRDGMMPEGNATTTTRPHLTVVDSPMLCSTIRCQDLGDDRPLADVVVAWINERELGSWRGTLCLPCYKAGTQIMVDCPRGAIWYIVRFLR